MALFHGLAAFPITPADEDGHVDVEALRGLVRRLVDARVDSIGLLGSTGTYAYLSRAERRRAIEVAVDEAGGKVPVMAGVGALRTDEATALAWDARQAGAEAGLLAPVSYTPLLDDEVFAHFQTVAGESELPLCIYNNPGVTHFTFSSDLIVRLSAVPGVVAVKNPAPAADKVGAHLAELRARVPAGFSLGYSGDANCPEAMIAGGDVWHSVLGGMFPKTALAICHAAQSGDAAQARRLTAYIAPLMSMFPDLTGLRLAYAVANILGLTTAAPPRPVLPLPDAARARVAAVVRSLELD
ncbi:MAG TPA: dihydrodipicolinate synthase family protein [Caulobacteraceae bacterium]|jgi:4-hydroxy-tetrahydrodipicolinate synthase